MSKCRYVVIFSIYVFVNVYKYTCLDWPFFFAFVCAPNYRKGRREEKRRDEKKRVKQRNTGFQIIKGEMTVLDLVDLEEGETFLLSLFPVVYLTTRIS